MLWLLVNLLQDQSFRQPLLLDINEMGTATLVDWRTITIASLALIATFGPKKINAMWQVIGGAILGYLLYHF